MSKISCLILLYLVNLTVAMIDFCRNFTFDKPTNMERLHFSKENSDREFGILGKFKCLHCCSHGYTSIEWFKDGQPYPWPTDVSTLSIHPESDNQTICSQEATPVDSGGYWCVARNDTHFIRHEVRLQISGPSISMGWPKTTYKPRDQAADLGGSVRFYCEAFVGVIDLPDFKSEMSWERYDLNQSFIDGERVVEEVIFREEQRVLGSYLIIKEVKLQDYGEYTCRVRNLGDQVVKLKAQLKRKKDTSFRSDSRTQQFWIFTFLLCLLIFIGSFAIICLLRLGFSRTFRVSQVPHYLDKNDILVLYHVKDSKKALKIVSGLRGKAFSSYTLHPLESGLELGDDVKAKADSHRGVLALISSNLLNKTWSSEGVHEWVQKLLEIHFTVACIFLEALPTNKVGSTESHLDDDATNKIYFLNENIESNLKFWDTLKDKFLLHRKDRKESSLTLI